MKTIILLLLLILPVSLFCQNRDSLTVIKVLSFNILHGATTENTFDLDKIASVIIQADPDLVSLQEVDYHTKRARNYDLATELGLRTKMAPIFGRAMYYDGGEYGEGILSKSSLISSRAVPLPYLKGDEPRTALEITTSLASGDTISFIGTHLDHLGKEDNRISQAKAIIESFRDNPYPTILSGDLNALPDSKTMQILYRQWTPTDGGDNKAYTFPSSNPSRKIDYIMYWPKKSWRVIETTTICDPIASDHCGYLATLELLKN